MRRSFASGCPRTYVIDAKGKEHVVQFAPETWWVADNTSLAAGTPSQYFIDAIEDSTDACREGNPLSRGVRIGLEIRKLRPSAVVPLLGEKCHRRFPDLLRRRHRPGQTEQLHGPLLG
jgi:hypothetical protein